MDGAAEQFALENMLTSGAGYTLSQIKPYIQLDSHGNLPACPANGTYAAGTAVSNPPTCTVSGHVFN